MKKLSIGQLLKHKRGSDEQTLHQVAISTNIDSTIISKIERGKRLPTTDQLKGFASHFSLPLNDLHAKLIAEQIVRDYGISKTTYQAVQIVQEEMATYSSNNKKKNS